MPPAVMIYLLKEQKIRIVYSNTVFPCLHLFIPRFKNIHRWSVFTPSCSYPILHVCLVQCAYFRGFG